MGEGEIFDGTLSSTSRNCHDCNKTGTCAHCMGTGEENVTDATQGLTQKDFNEGMLENAPMILVLFVCVAKILAEKVDKDSLGESLKEMKKKMIDEWEEEDEKPESVQFRKQFVESYAMFVEVTKQMKGRASQAGASEELANVAPESLPQGERRLSRNPYIAVAAMKVVDFVADLLVE